MFSFILVVFLYFFVALISVVGFLLLNQYAAGSCSSLASRFNLELLQSQYPNLYPVVTGALNASDDCSSAK